MNERLMTMTTKKFLPYHMGYLTDWMIKKAEKEFNETDETRGPTIDEFRRLIIEDGRFTVSLEDDFLLQYLRAMKFNIKRAFELLNNICREKRDLPHIWTKELDIASLRGIFEGGSSACLPYRDEEGCAVLIVKLGNWNPDIHSIEVAISALAAIVLYAVQDPATQVCGLKIIWDMKDTNFKHLKNIKFKYVKLIAKAWRNTFPVRIKSIHLVHESFVLTCLYAILSTFLSEKMKKRLLLHCENIKELHSYFPKEILPSEYGGDNENFNMKEWTRTNMESFYERYSELNRMGYKTELN